jgi:ubiquinone/menaquinone biosynthesis C-methylase UbiE
MRSERDVAGYYTETGVDYELWSRQLNMHFGFWRPGMSLFDRESMLEQMNIEVFARGALSSGTPRRLIDLGCGVGTVARAAADYFPQADIVGVTLVPWQARQAIGRTSRRLRDRVHFLVGDYLGMPFCGSVFDMAYALESSCYAPGTDKASLIEEVSRVLRPGGRIVIADAMLRQYPIRSPVTHSALRALCRGWKLPGLGVLDHVVDRLEDSGFADVVVEDISRNVTPSVLHAPSVSLRFFLRQFGRTSAPSKYRVENALMSLPLFVLSLDRGVAGYFIVSATRR